MATSVYSTFGDIYEAVINDAKEKTASTPIVDLVKRWINEGYETICFRKERKFLSDTFVLSMSGKVQGSCSVTLGSSIVTYTGTATLPTTGSTKLFGLKINGFEENYEITSISSNSIYLSTTYKGDTNAAANLTIFQRATILNAAISEVYEVWHDYMETEVVNYGPKRLRKTILGTPEQYDKAAAFALDGIDSSTEGKKLILWPYPDEDYTVYVKGTVYFEQLVNPTDEPRIPEEHRQILYWYALGKLWSYHRNDSQKAEAMGAFNTWLAKMDGTEEVSQDYGRLIVDYRRPKKRLYMHLFDRRYREDP